MPMRILLTNDDGIDSIGLHVLARAMREHGEVVIIAPDREFSGAGAALGALHLIVPEVCRRHIDGIDEAWSVSGPPALCVMFARLGAFGEPFDLIVSGINPGVNVGRSVYHSGTVGACLSGRNGHIPGVAVSQAVTGFGVEGQGWDEMLIGQKWHTAAAVASSFVGGMVEAIAAGTLDDAAVVNINVPNCELDEIDGWGHARVGVEPPRRMSSATLTPKEGHEDAFIVKMEWGDAVELPPDTDGGMVEQGKVAVSYLTRLEAHGRTDLTAAEAGLARLLG
jgi:5'-nucleotidase